MGFSKISYICLTLKRIITFVVALQVHVNLWPVCIFILYYYSKMKKEQLQAFNVWGKMKESIDSWVGDKGYL